MMKTRTKALMLSLSAVLLVVTTVFATMAYLTSTTDTVKNTFTFGRVGITLDEAKVDEYGKEISGAARVTVNDYKLIPGHTYVKDPTVHVNADSEESYVRMLVTVNWKEGEEPAESSSLYGKSAVEALQGVFSEANGFTGWTEDGTFLLQNLVTWNATEWPFASYDNGTYEFRHYTKVSTVDDEAISLEPLFESIVIPGTLTNDEIALLDNIEIDIVAHAIQADGFVDTTDSDGNIVYAVDNAWAAFGGN